MQEIIEQLDKVDESIRKKLTDHDYEDARKRDILMQVRESVQKAITLLLGWPKG